eukprot:1150499-Pelagomonas_calceolata.AAC.1
MCVHTYDLPAVGPGVSSSGIFFDKPEQMLEGCAMTTSTYCELERTRGHGFAVLLRECCAIDPHMRPTFTQACMQGGAQHTGISICFYKQIAKSYRRPSHGAKFRSTGSSTGNCATQRHVALESVTHNAVCRSVPMQLLGFVKKPSG